VSLGTLYIPLSVLLGPQLVLKAHFPQWPRPPLQEGAHQALSQDDRAYFSQILHMALGRIGIHRKSGPLSAPQVPPPLPVRQVFARCLVFSWTVTDSGDSTHIAPHVTASSLGTASDTILLSRGHSGCWARLT
jgi:hypothetical protein